MKTWYQALAFTCNLYRYTAVTRDRMMVEIAEKYPQYGFAEHKGYGTKAHMAAIHEHGPCPYHRRTFAPMKHMPGGGMQVELCLTHSLKAPGFKPLPLNINPGFKMCLSKFNLRHYTAVAAIVVGGGCVQAESS